jgi:hypothetical protein
MRPRASWVVLGGVLMIAGARADFGQDTTTDPAVLAELATRSSLPEASLRGLLSNCNANQQSENLCAWRDQIVAQRAFRAAVAGKAQELSACKADIEHRAAGWERRRDRSCARQAQKQYAGGSLRPTAQAVCLTQQTRKLTARIETIHACPSRSASQ